MNPLGKKKSKNQKKKKHSFEVIRLVETQMSVVVVVIVG
jgi:hypothetical protein